MQTLDRPAGRIRAVYGRTKGLVARRKALVSGRQRQQDGSSSESSGTESGEEKENKIPRSGQRQVTLAPAKEASSSSVAKGLEDSDDEGDVLSRRPRQSRLTNKARKGIASDEELDDLVFLMGKSLKVATSPAERQAKSKENLHGVHSALLALCGQEAPEDFGVCLLHMQGKQACSQWQKIGEASYSEVYGLSGCDSVVKIIPLLSDDRSHSDRPLPERSLPSEVHREVQLTMALSKVADSFVQMRSAKIVQGKYPTPLLQARAKKPAKNGEEDPSPELLPAEQLYAALELCNGGQDLESIEDLTWRQASSIFCQVVDALALAEQSHQFEHRDLHWGNVVVAPVESDAQDSTLVQASLVEQLRNPIQSGVKATIIDYTLSRATIGKTLIAYPFDDESLFEGKGDAQFDVYRHMRDETAGDWSGFYPHTNVLWLNYLASKLIDEKSIPNPKRRSRLDHRSSDELECRNLLMQVKQLMSCKRFDSAAHLNSALCTIPL